MRNKMRKLLKDFPRKIHVKKVLGLQGYEMHMGSMTMDAFINRFLDLLHYVPYIKEEKVKI